MAYCCVGSLRGKAAIRSSVEKRGRNPRVHINKQFLLEKFIGRKKKISSNWIRWKENSNEAGEKKWGTCWDSCCHWVKKIEAIHQKLKVQEDLDELDELADLENKLFGFIVAWYNLLWERVLSLWNGHQRTGGGAKRNLIAIWLLHIIYFLFSP